MKTTVIALARLALLAKLVSAQCPAPGTSKIITGACTPAAVKALGCELADLNLSDEGVQKLCEESGVPFGHIANNYYQFDKNFMDGGGDWNTDEETDVNMSLQASRLTSFANNKAGSSRVQWPKYKALEEYSKLYDATNEAYMSNFNLTESCESRAVTCCFVDARDPAKPLVNNTQVCHHNLKSSRRSSHVARGLGVYDANTQAYCTGFTWDADENSVSNRYKGNALYDVSYGTFHRDGFVKNIPGAPMCGCVEKMPTISNAACRDVNVANEEYTLSVDAEGVVSIKQTNADVTYGDCGGQTLSQHAAGTTDLSKHIVSDCDASKKEFLNDNLLVSGNHGRWEEPDPDKWIRVAGEGMLYVPVKSFNYTERDVGFREMYDAAPEPKIVHRWCPSCASTHQRIYYRRITAFPGAEEFSILNMFLNSWSKTNNTMGVDFNLYSTYDDAKTGTNPWKYCEYHDGVGLPYECGPTRETYCQWNDYTNRRKCDNGEYTALVNAFYLQKPTTP